MPPKREIELLTRKSEALKNRLALFKNSVLDIKNIVEIDENIDISEYIIELELRINKNTALLNDFEDIQLQLEGLNDNFDDHLQTRASFENAYFKTMSVAQKLLNSIAKTDSVHNSKNSFKSNSSKDDADIRKSVKLPTLQLPKFSGSFENWLEFRDMFLSIIHSNENISNIEKFQYLRASLEGGAADVIQSITTSSTNYNVAWELLCDRFDNKRLLVYNHVKALFNIKSLNKETAVGLRNLLDTISKHLRSLSELNEPTTYWDTLIVFMASSKLDQISTREWEEYKISKELPSLSDFKMFIKGKADLLETLEQKNETKLDIKYNKYEKVNKGQSFSNSKAAIVSDNVCPYCKESHSIQNCTSFLKLPVNKRFQAAKYNRLCVNCLKSGHYNKQCRSTFVCKHCNKKHNSLLHFNKSSFENTQSDCKPIDVLQEFEGTVQNHGIHASSTSNDTSVYPRYSVHTGPSKEIVNSKHSSNVHTQILLSTALIDVNDSSGNVHTCRVLLDSGSQSNFISEACYKKLGLKKSPSNLSIIGINQIISELNYKCNLVINSRYNSFSESVTCFLMHKVSDKLPCYKFNTSSWEIPKNFKLADPGYNIPGDIDILLGAGIFWNLLSQGQLGLGKNQPTIQNTKLGWVISGPFDCQPSLSYCNFSKNTDIQNQLAKFWEIEEVLSNSILLSDEENACELHFTDTFKQNKEGRFIVSIPFKESLSKLGDSRAVALKRFYSVERRLQSNPILKRMYIDFMNEYESLGHMSKIDEIKDNNISYYFPHHGVLKEERLTTKLRVVFNGSSPSNTGWSLNNLQMVGPTIQSDLFSILLRFREHLYVVAADIAKMYRQVLIEPGVRDLHRIFWRPDPTIQLQVYHLNTVTYGTASASFLSIRCIKQLAMDSHRDYPVASKVIERDFYVDDMLTGFSSAEEAVNVCKQVDLILKKGCFELRKWTSNNCEIVQQIQDKLVSNNIINFGTIESAKTLGLFWECHNDILKYKITISSDQNHLTKRVILSETSQIFDPLGLLSCCIILAKIILQKLWLLKCSWDDPLPLDIQRKWLQYRSDLLELNHLNIPRHVVCINPEYIELHGFSDASQDAYGGCFYIRSFNRAHGVHVRLLCSKARVAPIKSISIPRLELCGALVLARLYNKIKSSITIAIDKTIFWCDSTVVLAWIQTSPHRLQSFVGNRVSEIQQFTEISEWRHVPTTDNPADLLSRGVSPKNIVEYNIWWYGPEWLIQESMSWPNFPTVCQLEVPEMRKEVSASPTFVPDLFPFKDFSSYSRLIRVVAFCLRFKNNSLGQNLLREYGPLTVNELNYASQCVVRVVQQVCFAKELIALKNKNELPFNHKLLSLTPFLDAHGIIRVGGRLKQSQFKFDKMHPILLPSKHWLSYLIFLHEHIRLFHAGPQMILASVREKFWPIKGRNLARRVVRECILCHRFNPQRNHPIMADLPDRRTRPMPPFFTTGVDYAGPFNIKDRKGRGCKIQKCYVSLFICFTTKAVHLELVTELTKESFIAAFRRFVARRGKPNHMYSDNGTNFTSANSELVQLGNFLVKNSAYISELTSHEGVHWHFIPPHSPHFGGLWEAGVKSTKYHLKRVMSNARLTFEEFYTILTQIESILNSRPLTPLSSDPNDLMPLTPAHFLIGRPLVALPDPDIRDVPENRLSRFQYLQQINQHFWIRWTKEYISELQQRCKWKQNQHSLEVGTMVLVKDDRLPPQKWQLGRVVELHPGSDGVTRVATLKTVNGTIKRSCSKMCPLPIMEEHE